MHQKRIISLVFSVILSLTILTPAYAADMAMADSETAEVSTYNEYDYIMALKKCSRSAECSSKQFGCCRGNPRI